MRSIRFVPMEYRSMYPFNPKEHLKTGFFHQWSNNWDYVGDEYIEVTVAICEELGTGRIYVAYPENITFLNPQTIQTENG